MRVVVDGLILLFSRVFGRARRKIGKALGKTIKVSAVGVYSFDGAHEQQKKVRKGLWVKPKDVDGGSTPWGSMI